MATNRCLQAACLWNEILTYQDGTPSKEYTDADTAAALGFTGLLEILQPRIDTGDVRLTTKSADQAAANGYTKTLTFLRDLQRNTPLCTPLCSRRALKESVRNGHIEAVEWLLENSNEGCTWEALTITASTGNLPMFEILFKHAGLLDSGEDTPVLSLTCRSRVDAACAGGHINILEFLAANRPPGSESCTHLAIDSAAGGGHLEVLNWLLSHTGRRRLLRRLTATPAAMDQACANNHLEVVKWLASHRTEGCSPLALTGAAKAGHLEMVSWILDNVQNSRETFHQAAAASAGAGHLEVLKLIIKETNMIHSVPALMDAGAAGGHLEVVEWLHERGSPCTHECFDQAAANGHMQVLEFLHAKREEGGTWQALDLAATKGHLEIVKWLHDFRPEGCSTNAMDGAITHGHLEIVKFLFENRSEGCSKRALSMAAHMSNLEMVKWIIENRPPGTEENVNVIEYAAEAGALDILEYLYSSTQHTHACPHCIHNPINITHDEEQPTEEIHTHTHVNILHASASGVQLESLHSIQVPDLAVNLQHVPAPSHGGQCSVAPCASVNASENIHFNENIDVHDTKYGSATGNIQNMNMFSSNDTQYEVEYMKEDTNFMHKSAYAYRRAATTQCTCRWVCADVPASTLRISEEGIVSIGKSDRTIDWAATSGHLKVVEWLHKMRNEGSTVEAMDVAAQKGYVEVLDWLYVNTTTGVTLHGTPFFPSALERAAKEGQLNVLKWFYTNFGKDPFNWRVAEAAVSGGHIHLLSWLWDNGLTPLLTWSCIDRASINGDLHVLRWLWERTIVEKSCEVFPLKKGGEVRLEPSTCAFVKAIEHRHLHILQWLTKKYPRVAVEAMPWAMESVRAMTVPSLHVHQSQHTNDWEIEAHFRRQRQRSLPTGGCSPGCTIS